MSENNSQGSIVFTKEFTKQESIPEEGIQRALAVLRSGRLHRYNTAEGEISETALLEKEFAAFVGSKYCLACSSCGGSIYLALRSIGVETGDKILTNAYSLAPVPGAIVNAGAEPVLVEITKDYTIDFEDLEKKAKAGSAKFLLLSHMRGHMPDMDAVCDICRRYGISMIEDCAHTMGARWNGRPSGSFGNVACYSTQTYKHMNSGEGGLLTTDEDSIIAKAILYSGSYMLYDRHISRPPNEVFEPYKMIVPNFSMRMDNLRAAILRPQLRDLNRQCDRWNRRYKELENLLKKIDHIYIPERPAQEYFVGSSIQFSLAGVTRDQIMVFLAECKHRGVEIKWFGGSEPNGFTSNFRHWQYIKELPELPVTRRVLDFMCDFRIPLTFSIEDCRIIAEVIRQVAAETLIQ
ncbi:MAG: aminotransferase class I/II-fold pyridoxal phosphate-dependent enzyme [Desulfobacterales bacterium]